jgi:hypothetical protein
MTKTYKKTWHCLEALYIKAAKGGGNLAEGIRAE